MLLYVKKIMDGFKAELVILWGRVNQGNIRTVLPSRAG